MMKRTLAVLCLLFCSAPIGAQAPFPALQSVATYGRNIQRTMRLLATSTPARRNTVRILFYGQSITEQTWTKLVSEDLRRRFPHANLIIENRAIGGHSSPRLVKTMEADVFPFYPDLVIFHVYGDDGDYVFLPRVAKQYGAELVNQRELWKAYLREYKLTPGALLSDQVHLNAHGNYLMAEIVKAYLRYDPKLTSDADTGTVTWPMMLRVQRGDTPLLLENWTLTLTELGEGYKQARFKLTGSQTGEDGAGVSTERFVSNSGRIVIEPADGKTPITAIRVYRPARPRA